MEMKLSCYAQAGLSYLANKLQQTCQLPYVATSLLESGLLMALCYLQTRFNLLKQLAANLRITHFDNQLGTDLSSLSCRQLLSTHPDAGLL